MVPFSYIMNLSELVSAGVGSCHESCSQNCCLMNYILRYIYKTRLKTTHKGVQMGFWGFTYCDRCALMERELKKAANLVRMTKEKINFGVIKVNNIDDLNLNLKINRFPTLVAIKEGQDPKVYEEGEDYDYLRFVKFMRQLYNKNKIQKVNNEKSLNSIRNKHRHHLIVGSLGKYYI